MKRKCDVCGKEYEAKRKTSKYCSNTCRSRASRAHAFTGELKPVKKRPPVQKTPVSDLVQRAHMVAADFSRYSLVEPAPLCLKLRRIADGIETTLKREGL